MSALEDAVIAYGYCHCGCGEKTRRAYESNRCHGYIKGEPIRYIKGHSSRMPRPGRKPGASPQEKFRQHIDPARLDQDQCWPWPGTLTTNGYGRIQCRIARGLTRSFGAHRVAFEMLVGPIPPGLDLDHLCRNRACVNPAHLEPVTSAENTRRGAQTRLTAEDVAVIRASPKRVVTAASLARRFGVSEYHIHEIRRGTTWTAT